MVLSLALVLALIGSGAGLLVGIFAFSEVSDTLECPASTGTGGGGSPTFTSNTGSLGSSSDAEYFENDIQIPFNTISDGAINEAIRQEGTSSLDDQGEVRFGSPSDWQFFHTGNLGSDLISVNFWIRGDVTDPSFPEFPLFQTMNDPTTIDNGVYLFAQYSDVYLKIYENNLPNFNSANFLGKLPPDDSNWHMLTLTMNKEQIIAGYLTGVTFCLDSSCTGTDNSPFYNFTGLGTLSDAPLIFGSEDGYTPPVTENSFDLDDITIWQGYELTQSDVNALWNGGSGSSAGTTGSSIALGNQILHVTFDTSSGGGGGESETGSEQCQSAKDIAWSVIGIMPVALFFGLFTLFNFVIPKS